MNFGPAKPVTSLDDPVVRQAEKILAQRKARSLVIDPSVLGEPGWDILLSYFIAGHSERQPLAHEIATELGLSSAVMLRWRHALVDKGLLDKIGEKFQINAEVDTRLRALFTLQIKEEQRFSELG